MWMVYIRAGGFLIGCEVPLAFATPGRQVPDCVGGRGVHLYRARLPLQNALTLHPPSLLTCFAPQSFLSPVWFTPLRRSVHLDSIRAESIRLTCHRTSTP